jgi:hypothetical protein
MAILIEKVLGQGIICRQNKCKVFSTKWAKNLLFNQDFDYF